MGLSQLWAWACSPVCPWLTCIWVNTRGTYFHFSNGRVTYFSKDLCIFFSKCCQRNHYQSDLYAVCQHIVKEGEMLEVKELLTGLFFLLCFTDVWICLDVGFYYSFHQKNLFWSLVFIQSQSKRNCWKLCKDIQDIHFQCCFGYFIRSDSLIEHCACFPGGC